MMKILNDMEDHQVLTVKEVKELFQKTQKETRQNWLSKFSKEEQDEMKKKYNKPIYCKICDKNFLGSSVSHHRKSKGHIDAYNKLNPDKKIPYTTEEKMVHCEICNWTIIR